MNWYIKCLPTIKDLKKDLNKHIKNIKKINEVENLYLWGSVAENYHKPKTRIKNINFILSTNIIDADMLAVDKNALCIDNEDSLIDEGYNPDAVNLTKKISSITSSNPNILDIWLIPSNKILMHWGPILKSIKESELIFKKAAEFATENVEDDIDIKKRENWYRYYNDYLNNCFSDMPMGWYSSDESNINKILSKAKKCF